MIFRRFNDLGLKAFAEYINALRENPAAPLPGDMLTNDRLTAPLDPPIEAVPTTFNTRMDFACWLHDAAKAAETEIPRRDAGFWAWLTLWLFDQVCPLKNGKRKAGELARYIPMFDDWKRRYRHLLATPYNVFLIHSDNPMRAALILNVPLSVLGELTEQFASRQELVSCHGTMALATYLFVDIHANRKRSKASGNAARRLGKLLNQYTRTWDLPMIQTSAFAALLPKEFDKFKQEAASQAGGAAL